MLPLSSNVREFASYSILEHTFINNTLNGGISMVKIVSSVVELIGDTPIIKLSKVVPEGFADVYLKLEAFNVGGSIKDRIALNMIATAEERES